MDNFEAELHREGFLRRVSDRVKSALGVAAMPSGDSLETVAMLQQLGIIQSRTPDIDISYTPAEATPEQ